MCTQTPETSDCVVNVVALASATEERKKAWLARKDAKSVKRRAYVERIRDMNCSVCEQRGASSASDSSTSSGGCVSSIAKLAITAVQNPEPAHRVSVRRRGSPIVWIASDADTVENQLRSWTIDD
mmetsp:Transcript_56243/g.89259  ORF Transcript_56243/g.89259 Transcript_56243/m.89259 type:complete len:125 (-) Transcript_56243:352-726(-)